MTDHFPKKILRSRISLTYKRLTTNLGKILQSFENQAPAIQHTALRQWFTSINLAGLWKSVENSAEITGSFGSKTYCILQTTAKTEQQ